MNTIAPALNNWYATNARTLPWRHPDTTPWAILVSEFMLQQTQVDRVIPRWSTWVTRWPTPNSLAAEQPGEAIRAWDRLGYPRRALWLHRAATHLTEHHNGHVPNNIDELLQITGIGPYTARAIAVFAYQKRHPVVDTNTRRVLARLIHGQAQAGTPNHQDLNDMEQLLPQEPNEAATFNAAAMELGALTCTTRTPQCQQCPIAQWCQWRGAGFPDNAPKRRTPHTTFNGSDRQVRGRIMALLRSKTTPTTITDALHAATIGGIRDPEQPRRAYNSLVADGLIIEHQTNATLP